MHYPIFIGHYEPQELLDRANCMMELKNKMFDEEEFESRNSYFGNARFVRKIVQPRIGDHSLHLIYVPCSDRSIEKNETIILQDLNTFTGPNADSATGRTTIEF